MISLVDFVKAFNSNLEYRILIVFDEICDVFSGNKEEFIKRVKKVVKLKVQLNRLYLFMIKLINLQFF